ncbi:MAG: sugar phosphate nucleotidyltransferase [Bacteroides sp.]|nr:sugar phosphate nucleotidyltransferase [Roseburia sp.]MCM1345510.1 sugar phosphate nucleotidyltransferase [Bacteroides sp.]MCM1420019.1 sugar phosphate nucleotidyltransferase [Bacteroides sp.]
MNKNNYCVILAGGVGQRLWPSSRRQTPKQFIDFFGSGETLLQTTFKRYSRFIDKDNIIVVSNAMYADIVVEQLPDIPKKNILLEPMRRNTVPSVTWAAMEIIQRNKEACIVVTPVDQMIAGEDFFVEDVLAGLDYVARNQRMLTLGAMPTRPETSYGYIQMADKLEKHIYKVKSFTEKPELDFARLFVENKEFLWNTGLFIWSARTFLEAVHNKASYYTEMMDDASRLFNNGVRPSEFVEEAFSMCPNVSIEQGILEKSDNVDVMLCHFGWTDIGTWNALYNVMPKDADGNVAVDSQVMFYDCKGCIVKMPDGKIAVLQGLEDYVIADEDNVLMVCHRGEQGAMRKFVNDVQLNAGDDFV